MGEITINIRVLGNGYVILYFLDINGSNQFEPVLTIDGNGSCGQYTFKSTPVNWYKKNKYLIMGHSHDNINNPFIKFCTTVTQTVCKSELIGDIGYFDSSYQEWIAYLAPVPDPRPVTEIAITIASHGNGKADIYKNGSLMAHIVSNIIVKGTFPMPWLEYGYEPWLKTGDIMEIVPVSVDLSNPFIKFCDTYYQKNCNASSTFKTIIEDTNIEKHLYFFPVEPAPAQLPTNRMLKNLVNTFLSGNVSGCNFPNACYCVTASKATSYYLASLAGDSYWNRWINNCNGIILENQKGYLQILLHIYLYNKRYQSGPSVFYIYGSDNNINYNLIYKRVFNSPASTSLEFLEEDILIQISNKFILLKGEVYPLESVGESATVGYVLVSQLQLLKNISIYAHTPQNYPIYNAAITLVDTNTDETLGNLITDMNGITPEISVDIVAHEQIKIWGEKTIDKTILNKTAKEVSELNNINADEKPNNNIPP